METFLVLMGLLLWCLIPVFAVIGIVRKIRRKPGKWCWLMLLVCLVGGIVLMVSSVVVTNHRLKQTWEAHEMQEIEIQTTYDFEVKDGDEPLVYETSRGFHEEIVSYRYIYDTADLHLAIEHADGNQCIQAIWDNPGIGGEYKTFFIDFVKRIMDQYPEADLSILYRNLQTLQVSVLPSSEFMIKSLDANSYGCYRMDENAIYIPEGTVYTEGEWGFQVLIHEFCHVVRGSWFEQDDYKYHLEFNSDSDYIMLSECMNSVFSCSLLNYEERDIAYQTPSNYLRVMLECMDNYELTDYINHGSYYFLKQLDEATGYTNYASVIWKLIAVQRQDWQDDRMDIDPAEYYPIYDYLCDMYYHKYYRPEMTEEEKQKLAEALADKAFFDTPEGYKEDAEYVKARLLELMQ